MNLPLGRAQRPRSGLIWLILTLALAGCASAPNDSVTQTKDPWEKMNRATFAFNQAVDKAVARPVAKAYKRAVPAPARGRVHDFFSNLGEPVTVANDALQAKGRQTLRDFGRFLINSTFGLFGLFDVASHVGLPQNDEDLGQTLATWGVPSGPYLVLPFLGPSTVRDTGGLYGDYYTNPVKNDMQARYRNEGFLLDAVDKRAGLLDFDSALDSAYDPYTFMRDAYLQHRRFEIFDGNPPVQYPDYPELEDDDSSPAPAAASAPPAATSTTAAQSVSTVPPPSGFE